MKHAWVYILLCADGSYYTGCTTNLAQRIRQHETGMFRGYTYTRRPVKLMWCGGCPDIRDAIATEKQIKNW
jgi:predicted GIY-YIG superfamily endonuclease